MKKHQERSPVNQKRLREQIPAGSAHAFCILKRPSGHTRSMLFAWGRLLVHTVPCSGLLEGSPRFWTIMSASG